MAKKIFLFLVLSLYLTGCSTTKMYEGPKKPNNELALFKPIGINIIEIDGKKVQRIKQSSVIGLNPGTHTFKATLHGSNLMYKMRSSVPQEVTVESEKGGRYALHGSVEPPSWKIIVNTEMSKALFFLP